ncbi:MAG: anaerobic ribonucleoside-triphosphate reductase activating protein [Candidatus Methanomethyliaceae archaeon]|nr:anaerobic ribonucleoside-triphosphate reductase activating protein [Candidatus Methanomethyliaceae archaeon]MDW7970735.1 anaerobic ribonucleoside-triphosphate reductase activating protein [Nitrososphaerota archaeon]
MIAYIAEIIPISFSDYPKEPCCVIFFSGCNFDCGYCQNWKIKKQSEEHAIDIEKIKEIISKNNLITACKISGGEPLLQLEALLEIGNFVKSLGLKFGIDTNGSMPNALKKAISLLDLISIDIKAPLKMERYAKITGLSNPPLSSIIESLKIAIQSNAYLDVRIVVIPGFNDSIEDVKSIVKVLKELGYENRSSKSSFTLMEFVPENAHREEFRKLSNTSLKNLMDLASSIELSNVKIYHRAFPITL